MKIATHVQIVHAQHAFLDTIMMEVNAQVAQLHVHPALVTVLHALQLHAYPAQLGITFKYNILAAPFLELPSKGKVL